MVQTLIFTNKIHFKGCETTPTVRHQSTDTQNNVRGGQKETYHDSTAVRNGESSCKGESVILPHMCYIIGGGRF